MPARYDYAIPTDPTTTWDFSKYQPHVVIMNLTNNNFSTGGPGQPYIDAYLPLTKHIRSNYPDAAFIHIMGDWEHDRRDGPNRHQPDGREERDHDGCALVVRNAGAGEDIAVEIGGTA